VLLDAQSGTPSLAYSCLTLTAACADRSVRTIEGVADSDALHPVQSAFIEHDAAQCGYCTPGQILAAIALLDRTPHPSANDVVRGMSGNLCRCGTYPNIVQAVLAAAKRMASAEASHG
jgi:aerobic-type carbon monoxide dehydrogenase small subunit (CoxS/CutS family)